MSEKQFLVFGIFGTEPRLRQLGSHLKKLEEFKANPDKFDNKGFLKGVSAERRRKIIDGRIRNLQKQIENFRKQIKLLEVEN